MKTNAIPVAVSNLLLGLAFTTMAGAEVTGVVVDSSSALGTFRGKPYLEAKGTMVGTVMREDGTTGDYAVPITLAYPADAGDCNGLGIVEPLHQSLTHYALATMGADSLFGNGYVYAVTAWDSTGVAQLSDGWQILRDCASLLRQPGDLYQNLEAPAPCAVPTIIAFGISRTGFLLRGFVASGRNADLVFDGLLITKAGALCLNLDGPARLIVACPDPLPAHGKIIAVNTEHDVERYQGWRARPDPETPPASFRLYEVAGVSHIEKGATNLTPLGATRQNPASPGPLFKAMLAHLRAWIEAGDEPPPSVIMPGEVSDPPAGDLVPPTGCIAPPCPIFYFLRDGYGNAAGGVRLPHIAAPLGTYTGVETDLAAVAPPNRALVSFGGTFTQFDEATLNALYPYPGDYVNAIAAAANDARQAGWILAEDARPYELLNIVTVAGKDADIGDGGPATAAQLNNPAAVAFDSSGNRYITEGAGHRVRKVDTVTRIITTYAGTGGNGFNGDNIQATAAQLNAPRGVVVDSSGNLYITESGGHRVRKVTLATGIITTVAGTGVAGSTADDGPATAAQINAPGFPVFDSSGNLYISEANGNRIRKVVPGANGVIDGASDETITTVAGTGVPGFAGDDGPATAAQFRNPNGLSIDSSGNLYIADVNNNRVRFVNLGITTTTVLGQTVEPGNITTVAGGNARTGTTTTDDTTVMITDTTGLLPGIAVFGAGIPSGTTIVSITPSASITLSQAATLSGTTTLTTIAPGFSGNGGPATAAQLNAPRTVTVDSADNLYIADFNNNRVRKVDTTGTITPFAGTGVRGFSGDDGPAIAAELNGPNTVSFDSLGNLYLAESLGHRVRMVDTTEIITTFAGGGSPVLGDGGPATAAQFDPSSGVAFDSSGDLYIADLVNNRIRKVNLATGIISTFAGTGVTGSTGDGLLATAAQLNGPFAIAFDSSGNLYIADSTGRRVRQVDMAEIITTFAGTGVSGSGGDDGPAAAAQVNNPQGLAVDSSGNLYISEFGGHRVRQVNLATVIITTLAGTGVTGFSGDDGPATAARLNTPQGVAVDSSGNRYIADVGNSRIRKVDATGIITTVAGTGIRGFSGDGGPATAATLDIPQSVAFDAAGNLYIVDGNRIRKVDTMGIITTIAGTGVGVFWGDGGPATAAQLNGPRGVALDFAGNLYITDSGNSRIRRLNVAAKTVSVHLNQDGAGSVEALVELYGTRDPNTLANVTLRTIDAAGQPTSEAFAGTDLGPDPSDPQKRWFSFGPNTTLLAGLSFRLEGLFIDDGKTCSGDAFFPITWSNPMLTITLTSANTVVVSWPFPSTGFELQENTDLNTTDWTTPPETVTDDGVNNSITVELPTGNRFYRLYKP